MHRMSQNFKRFFEKSTLKSQLSKISEKNQKMVFTLTEKEQGNEGIKKPDLSPIMSPILKNSERNEDYDEKEVSSPNDIDNIKNVNELQKLAKQKILKIASLNEENEDLNILNSKLKNIITLKEKESHEKPENEK